jgi:hypothetical protein
VSAERRRFLRQGQLAGAIVGGIAASVIAGLLPPRLELVETGAQLGGVAPETVLLWLGPMVAGMAVGYVVWTMLFEHRRPSLVGRPWSGERDWAITGGLFVAYVLTRALVPPASERASGLYSTGDPALFLLVDAPVDTAIALVRFLASAGIGAVLLRLVFDALQPRPRQPSAEADMAR